ncbi:MAG: cellulase family glycosylhydrolase [Verrucomicrobiota bacterium]
MRRFLLSTTLVLMAACLPLHHTGQPRRFIGVNCFDLARYADRADDIFAHLATNGVRVVRFWAFQKYCGPTGTNFARFDQIIAAGKHHGIQLLPVLENHWKHCTYNAGLEWKPPAWYDTGWRTEKFGGAPLTYRDYLHAIVRHFQNEPQILAWQLVNEPEIEPDTPASFATLRRFTRDVSRELKQADPYHPVSLGLLGLGQPATTGQQFRQLHNLPGIDLVTAHDHGYMNEPLAGKDWPLVENSLYADLLDARALRKPFIVTEAGIAIEWVNGDRVKRAELFRAKLRAFFAAGGTGYILWNYEPEPDTNYGFGPTDPVLPMLRQMAAELSL